MTHKIAASALLILLTVGQLGFGQQNFNYAKDFTVIREKTKDPNQTLSYDKLLHRFTSNDTTMTDFEVLALLIGYTDKSEFRPYDYVDTERNIDRLNDEGKYPEALDKANEFLMSHPVSQQALIEKSYAHYKLGNKDSANYYSYQFRRIMEAMYFSGIGTTPETPTFALGPADGQNYIRKFVGADIGSMGSGRDKHGNFLDILEAKFEDGQSINLYFIIQHATDKMFSEEDLRMFRDKESNKPKKKNKNSL